MRMRYWRAISTQENEYYYHYYHKVSQHTDLQALLSTFALSLHYHLLSLTVTYAVTTERVFYQKLSDNYLRSVGAQAQEFSDNFRIKTRSQYHLYNRSNDFRENHSQKEPFSDEFSRKLDRTFHYPRVMSHLRR